MGKQKSLSVSCIHIYKYSIHRRNKPDCTTESIQMNINEKIRK